MKERDIKLEVLHFYGADIKKCEEYIASVPLQKDATYLLFEVKFLGNESRVFALPAKLVNDDTKEEREAALNQIIQKVIDLL